MVFKKRVFRRKVYPKRKRKIIKRGTNWGSVAKTALKTAKWVASIVNTEYKYNIVSSSLTSVGWTGTLWTLCDPSQGVGATQRTGDSIKIKNIDLRGVIDFNIGMNTPETIRIIIFNDKLNKVTAASDFLQYTGVYLATESDKNEDNKYNTKTIYDKRFAISANKPQANFKIDLKIDLHQHYTVGTTTITNNAIKMLVISQNPIGANNNKISFISRSSYVDN